jgi:ribosomal protein S18 acetylase RimI-like enzyme
MRTDITIRRMAEPDGDRVAEVHREAFPRQQNSRDWVRCNFAAFPRIQIFVAVRDHKILGFIQWIQKSGFRPSVVLELEQIAVRETERGTGIGQTLIKESMAQVKAQLKERNATIRSVLVTTRADNAAQWLYRKALGANVEATITELYSADEVVMVARDVENET